MKRSILAITIFSFLCACSVESDGGDGNDEDTSVDAGTGGGDDTPGQPDGAPGATDLTDYCNQWNAAVCAHIFACLTQEERDAAGVPPTEEQCVSAQAPDCEDATSENVCAGDEVYMADQTTPCLTQFAALTCDQFRSNDPDAVLAEAAPACVAMCQ
jgi:hypothetical protein